LAVEFFGERDDDAVGSAEVAEAVEALVSRDLTDEFGAVHLHGR
jgi:hypothetical protein